MFSSKKSDDQESQEGFTMTGKDLDECTAVTRIESQLARIGASIRIEGEITGQESLQIEGTVKGSVVLEQHRVVIFATGTVEGEIKADVVEVFGKCKGEICGYSEVIIHKSGEVEGDIKAPSVALEPGAHFKGSVDMGDGKPALTQKKLKINNSIEKKNTSTNSNKIEKSSNGAHGLNETY